MPDAGNVIEKGLSGTVHHQGNYTLNLKIVNRIFLFLICFYYEPRSHSVRQMLLPFMTSFVLSSGFITNTIILQGLLGLGQ